MGNVFAPKETALAQWYDMVREAESSSGLSVDEELECYLVNLLLRFMNQPEMAGTVLGLDYLLAEQQASSDGCEHLRDVGDQCLLYSGLFPERSLRRRVRTSYFVELGQRSYCSVAMRVTREPGIAELFEHLGQRFVRLMDILQTMRALSGPERELSLLLAVDLWQDTGSQAARSIITKHTDGFVVRKG